MASTAIVPALASCGSQAEMGDEHDNRSQMISNAAVTSVASPKAAQTIPRAAPVTDSQHFDLHCELHGRIVSDAHPELSHGTYPANEPAWRDHPDFVVDLQTMQICDLSTCDREGPFRIVSAAADRIVLRDDPQVSIYIRPGDLWYEQRIEDMGRVSVTRGQCTKAPFSGFPVDTARAHSR
jgi:hypothetical protein